MKKIKKSSLTPMPLRDSINSRMVIVRSEFDTFSFHCNSDGIVETDPWDKASSFSLNGKAMRDAVDKMKSEGYVVSYVGSGLDGIFFDFDLEERKTLLKTPSRSVKFLSV